MGIDDRRCKRRSLVAEIRRDGDGEYPGGTDISQDALINSSMLEFEPVILARSIHKLLQPLLCP
jgi:hypothetical protein